MPPGQGDPYEGSRDCTSPLDAPARIVSVAEGRATEVELDAAPSVQRVRGRLIVTGIEPCPPTTPPQGCMVMHRAPPVRLASVEHDSLTVAGAGWLEDHSFQLEVLEPGTYELSLRLWTGVSELELRQRLACARGVTTWSRTLPLADVELRGLAPGESVEFTWVGEDGLEASGTICGVYFVLGQWRSGPRLPWGRIEILDGDGAPRTFLVTEGENVFEL